MVPALKNVPNLAPYKKGDVMVVFGELFNRGYANGIVDEAERRGLKVIHATVGRRDGKELRPLNSEELADKPQSLINIPLEAGFDMEPDSKGVTPVDQLSGYKMSTWKDIKLDWSSIEESKNRSIERFINNTKNYVTKVSQEIPKGANVLFVHIMAGGVPRTKIVMPVMNRVFKGRGDRFVASQDFLESELGKFCHMNFNEVTAYTYRHLIEQTAELRGQIEADGGHTSYVAYGYHGTEVLHGDEYKWQTYTPYFQGWAKMELENVSKEYFDKGINTCVFNCPEILTNSSSIFQGVEVSLYPLLGALEKNASTYNKKVLAHCQSLLNEGRTFTEVMDFTLSYFNHDLTKSHSHFDQWPQHNSKDQMNYMLDSSDHLISMHKDPKQLMTAVLSEEVFKSTGTLMFHESWKPSGPVLWLGHDVIAEQMAGND